MRTLHSRKVLSLKRTERQDLEPSPDYSQALCCGIEPASVGGAILARRSSTYLSNTPPVGSLVFLAITEISGTSRRGLRIIWARKSPWISSLSRR
jgi:hypothetical protein